VGTRRDEFDQVAAYIPPELVDAFLRLCQGDFAHRLPRTRTRDAADTVAFFFNAVAEEFERAVTSGRTQDEKLTRTVDALSQVLLRTAAGDLAAQAPRDFSGDELDVLSFLVNSTIAEIAALVAERERRNGEEHDRLEWTIAVRTDELRLSEARFRMLFDAAPMGLLMIRVSDGAVVAANALVATIFGVDGAPDPKGGRDQWIDRTTRDRMVEVIKRAGHADAVEVQFRRRGGQMFWAELSGRLVTLEGDDLAVLAGIRDITEQKQLLDQLQELASVDALTRLLNRRRFLEEADGEVKRAMRYRAPLCCLMIDIDHFKTINDRFGHVAGDDALRATAGKLRGGLRATDKIGRLGGEEFAVLAAQSAQADGRQLAERLRTEVEAMDFRVGGERVPLTVSIGVVQWRSGENVDDVLKRADASLYAAKSAGRNCVAGEA